MKKIFLLILLLVIPSGCMKARAPAARALTAAKKLVQSPVVTPVVHQTKTAVAAGGTSISTGTGMMLRSTVGQIANPNPQTGTGVLLFSGLQGSIK